MEKKKKYWRIGIGILLVVLIVVMATGGYFLGSWAGRWLQKKKTEKIPPLITRQFAIITIQPQGELKEIPNRIVFQVEGPIKRISPAARVDYETARKCLIFQPDIKGYIRWVSPRMFEYVIEEETLQPNTRYNAVLECLPISSTYLEKEVVRKTFYIHIPPLFAVNAWVTRWHRETVEARVNFTFPIRLLGAEQYFSVSAPDGKPVDIWRVEKAPKLEGITVVWKNTGEKRYFLTIRKGLLSADGKTALENDITFELHYPERTVVIGALSTTETAEGVSIEVQCSVQGLSTCTVEPAKVKNYIRISPDIPFTIVAGTNGFSLQGNFLILQTYEVSVLAGLFTREGGVLATDYVGQVKIPPPSPRLSFAVKGHYLGKKGNVKIPLQVRLVDTIYVNIYRIPPENIGLYSPWSFGWNVYEPVVSSKEVKVNAGNQPQLFWLDLSQFIPIGEAGVFYITVTRKKPEREPMEDYEYEEDYWEDYDYSDDYRFREDSVVLVITDLALIAKRAKNVVHIWAVNTGNGTLVSGAEVKLLSQRNVVLGNCSTDASGYCSIKFDPIRKREAHVIVAQKNGEWTFLNFDNVIVNMEDFDVGGLPIREYHYLSYIYPERDIYRPGETVHFATVVREKKSYKGVALPVVVKVFDPKGKEIAVLQKNTNPSGMADFSLPTETSAITGKYALQLYVGEKLLTSSFVFIETFVPERITVTVSIPKKDYLQDEPIPVEIQADYLFGVPAKEAEFSIVCSIEEGNFQPKGFMGYSFGWQRGDREKAPTDILPPVKGRLDENGKAKGECAFPDLGKYLNRINLNIYTEVWEAEGGRSSKAFTRASIHPFPFYIGLKPESRVIQSGRKFKIDGVLVKPDGTLHTEPTELIFQPYRIWYDYVRIFNPETLRFEWKSTEQRMPISEPIPITVRDGKFLVDLVPEQPWYDYFVEVRDIQMRSIAGIRLDGWGWWWEEERPESPEVLDIFLSKSVADYGESVRAEVLLPFEGKILWTLELDDVYQVQWQEANGNKANWNFSVPTGTSSVYVTALLIRLGENYMVRRAFGVKRLKVEPRRHRLELTVNVPDRVRPGDTLTLSIQGKSEFDATVAIVDEGILQVTRFSSPDVYQAIFTNLALQVDTAETLGWVVPKGLELPGGAEVMEAPPQPTFIRLVSFWSTLKRSDKKGNLTVQFPIPPYQGKLRIMVSAANENALASAEKFVTVASDVVVQPTLPRFVYFNDHFSFPISFLNTTQKTTKTKLNVQINNRAQKKEVPSEIVLRPQEKKVYWIPVDVPEFQNSLSIHISALTDKEIFEDTLHIPVYPNRVYVQEGKYLELKGGKHDLLPQFQDWIPVLLKSRVVVSSLPDIIRLSQLRSLIQYPYGCIEQTASSILPQIRLASFIRGVLPEITENQIYQNVNQGIARILSMQTPSGGFGFWPGDTEPSGWSSVYATFVLLEAKDAGYYVPTSALDSALLYIEHIARREAFGYFVLAKANRLKRADVEELIRLATTQNLYSEDLLWIAGVLSLAGRVDSAEMVLEMALKSAKKKTESLHGNFYSPLREIGLRLYIAETVRPGHAKNAALMWDVLHNLRERNYDFYSTQELAWGILGVGLRLNKVPVSRKFHATLLVEGKEIPPEEISFGLQWNISEASRKKSIQLNLETDGVVYVYVENEGFKKDKSAFGQESQGISLSRRFLDLQGNPIAGSLGLKELFLMEISLTNTYPDHLHNLAVEGRIPAGWEIENPRLLGTLKIPWLEKADTWKTDYVDIHDESIRLFGYLPHGQTEKYYVLLRVVTPGTFFLPPISASVMYRPAIRAQTSSGNVTIPLPSATK
ncbi:MAG: alpha-2-macroglobulin family protein [bacterium JZ-2024 1]